LMLKQIAFIFVSFQNRCFCVRDTFITDLSTRRISKLSSFISGLARFQ